MWADAHAARRCRLRRPASQPLWSCQHYSLNQKATPKRLRQQLASGTSESDALLRAFSPRLRGLCFFSKCIQKHLQTPTSKHSPPNTRYISSAEFSKTAFVKNNPMKKAGGQGFLYLSRISFNSGSEKRTSARLSFLAGVKGTVCPSRALEYCPSRLSSAESFCGVL